MAAASMPPGVDRPVSTRTRLLRRCIRFIVAFTIAYNVIEAIVALLRKRPHATADDAALLEG